MVGLTEQRATSSKVRAAEEATLAVVDAIFRASDIPRIRYSSYPSGGRSLGTENDDFLLSRA